MARKHNKGGWRDDDEDEAAEAPPPPPCWLCGRPCGETVVWHHPIPKSRGGRETVPMHPICQNTLIANFTNSELQRAGMDVDQLLANPTIRKFVDWVANKDPDFNASIAKKGR
ncbi:hypothetical protein [Novosphingobium sp. AAP93]|uniref:hypothetical protein n=1 Tax=Novosphingobium sp. AAP93 TaxID=1523427 RepID=UPI0006B8B19F|nr:hypothetical protein [Novosphingobium sp. AAP93]KPF88602.1 hypothetical protein IP83_05095 [Novosphingobium sp. AAP93]